MNCQALRVLLHLLTLCCCCYVASGVNDVNGLLVYSATRREQTIAVTIDLRCAGQVRNITPAYNAVFHNDLSLYGGALDKKLGVYYSFAFKRLDGSLVTMATFYKTPMSLKSSPMSLKSSPMSLKSSPMSPISLKSSPSLQPPSSLESLGSSSFSVSPITSVLDPLASSSSSGSANDVTPLKTCHFSQLFVTSPLTCVVYSPERQRIFLVVANQDNNEQGDINSATLVEINPVNCVISNSRNLFTSTLFAKKKWRFWTNGVKTCAHVNKSLFFLASLADGNQQTCYVLQLSLENGQIRLIEHSQPNAFCQQQNSVFGIHLNAVEQGRKSYMYLSVGQTHLWKFDMYTYTFSSIQRLANLSSNAWSLHVNSSNGKVMIVSLEQNGVYTFDPQLNNWNKIATLAPINNTGTFLESTVHIDELSDDSTSVPIYLLYIAAIVWGTICCMAVTLLFCFLVYSVNKKINRDVERVRLD